MITTTKKNPNQEKPFIIKQLISLTNEKIIAKGMDYVEEDTELLMLDIFDSMGMVIFLTFVEETYNLQIPDEEVNPENFQNFDSIADLILKYKDLQGDSAISSSKNESPVKRAITMVQNGQVKSKEFQLSNGESLHTLSVEGEQDTWVLIPGLGNPSSSWVTILNGLYEDHNAYALDFNGFGVSSSINECPNFKNHYEAISEFIEQIDEESLVLVGSSAGSMIAMEVARRFPEKVKALIITGFGLVENSEAWWDNLQQLSKNPESFLTAAYHRPPELNATLENLIKDVMSRPAYWSFLEGGGLEEMKICTDNINVPTLIVQGESDQIIPKEAVTLAHQKIPNAKIEWLSRCGHFPPVEQPEELIYVIKNFLEEL